MKHFIQAGQEKIVLFSSRPGTLAEEETFSTESHYSA